MRVLIKGIIKLILIVLVISALIYNYKTDAISAEATIALEKAGVNVIDRDAYLKMYPSSLDCSKQQWRDWGPGIIKCDIGEDEIEKIRPVAEQVKGKDILETTWNLHYWLVNNTEYDYEKFMMMREGTLLPHEFLEKKTGVCRDYAVFNYAVMKALGYKDIYLGHISMSSSIYGHSVLVFRYNGTYYALDWWGPQKMDQTYAQRWQGALSVVILDNRGRIVDYVGVTPTWLINDAPTLAVNVIGFLMIIVILKL
jgi:hypothetical protein